MPDSTLRRINDVLTVTVICLGLYVVVLPFWPAITYWFRDKSVPYQVSSLGVSADETKQRPEGDHLLIPSIGMDEAIYQGSQSELNKGAWLRPKTSTPDKGSNSVIVGHRFTYTDDNAVFYHLDKVVPGDIIAVYWGGKEFNYRVREVKVVPASAIEIEDPTDNAQLTLYTCTPLWSAKDRLVVVADEIYREEP